MTTTTNQKRECQSTSRQSWSRQSWRRGSSSQSVRKASARVYRVLAATPAALRSNNVQFAGLVLIALGPLAEIAYRFLEPTPVQSGSYWSPYWYLFAIGQDMSTILYASGFYLLIPMSSKLKYIAVVPIAYKLAKIIYILGWVDDDTAFHGHIPAAFFLYGLATAIVWLAVFEYLITLHFHKRTGHIARVEGILSATNIDSEKQVAIALNEIKAFKALK